MDKFLDLFTSLIKAQLRDSISVHLSLDLNSWYFYLTLLSTAYDLIYQGSFYTSFLQVKPLGVIWGKFSEYYSKKNTIMFDDIGRNFLMNPQNGLKVVLTGNVIYYYFFV